VGTDPVRWDDARSLLRLAGEGSEIGPRTEACREHLVAGLTSLVGAELGMFVIDPVFARGGRGGVDHMTVSGFDQSMIPGLELVLYVEGREAHPVMKQMLRQDDWRAPGGLLTVSRSELVPNHGWYESPYVADYLRPARYDDWLVSVRSQSNYPVVSGIGLIRAAGCKPFSSRESAIVRLFHEGCDSMLVPPSGPTLGDLSPRLRQALDCLLSGAGDKTIAVEMGISHHTAREYTQKILRIFGVSSRAQLIARLAGHAATSPGVNTNGGRG
jgi:DNA-binding CsgD family transcriptional regulator